MRRIVILAALILSSAFGPRAQAQNTISTVVGGGTNTATATSAYLSGSFGVARDTTNHVTYLSISALSIVYKVDSSGNMTPYAGNGVLGFSGDGKAATSAQLDGPNGIAVDGGGNLFIADSQNNRIRRVDFNTHVITTVAGSGNQYNGIGFFGGYTGDGGPASSALLNFPVAVAVDGGGDLFIADSNNNVIRKVDNSPQHIITTYAGGAATVCAGATDPIGDGCPATSAQLNSPEGLAVDSIGNVFIADSGDNVVRMVNTAQIITTYAGGGTGCTAQTDPLGDGCPANQAGLNNPQGVSVDSSDNLYIADTFNNRIRKVDGIALHNISTLAGSASICLATTGCGDGGAATSALLNSPTSVAVDGSTLNVFFCDAGTQRFRMVIPGTTPIINSYAGGGAGGDGNAATAAVIGSPGFVIVDGAGDLFVVDGAASRIRKVNATSQVITNFAGNGVVGPPGNSNGDGSSALQANLTQVTHGMAFDPSGNLYFIDRSNFVIRRIDTSGTITRVAGNYGQRCAGASLPSCGDGGLATSALLRAPTGIAVDSTGNVYISDGGLNRIRVFSPGGNISNFAGTGAAGSANGPGLSVTFTGPWGIAFDANGNLYVADAGNNLIRKIDNTTQHNVTTYAFNGVATFGGDGGTALSASMQFPQQVSLDSAGNLYVGGGFDNVVRRIDVNDQSVITVAGDIHNLDGGFSGDGGPSTKALLENFGLAIFKNTSNNTNTLYIADQGNNRIRKVVLAPVAQVSPSALQDFGPVLQGGFGAPQIITIVNNGLDDLVITPGTPPPGFTVTNDCVSLTTFTPAPLAPGQSCLLIVQFGPGAMTGPVTGTFTLTTNDPANPSFPFQLSGTAVAPPGVALTVTVSPSPNSPNPVVFSSPSGIDCPTTCSSNFAAGEIVSLNAISSSTSGQVFIGWTVNGSTTTCPGTGACTLTMSQAQNVTANFGPASVRVSALGNGSGTIAINPGGVNCTVTNGVIAPNPCIATNFPAGTTTVTVTASATGNSSFAGWLGFCSATGINNAGTGPCDLSLTLASLPSLSGALATAVFSGPPVAFSQGQVFVGTVDGMIFVYNSNGTLAQVLNSGNLGGTIAGMNFDATGNLYAANLVANTVERFASGTAGPTTFGTGYNSGPLGVLVDALGNVFVGQSGGQKSLLEFAVPFNGNGTPTNTFFPAYDIGGIGYLELLDDGASVLYTSSTQTGAGLGSVKNYDIANSHQNPDFATNLPGGPAFAVRELSDKSVLVANSTQIVRIDPISRNVVKTYTPGGAGVFFALNLNPDGQSFWAGDAATGKVYQVNLATGAVMNTINTGLGFNTATLTFTTVFGIAVFGQPQSGGADVAITMTAAPNPVAQGSQLTYTINVKNNGPLAAANVAVTDALPPGATFVSASTGQGTCSGTTTVTCNLGTGSNGMSATITIVVTATQAGTLTNAVNVNATTPDPIPGNNSFTTTTTVTATGPAPATITMSAPSSVQLGTGLTYAIQVTNSGTTTLTNLTVADTLPGNLNATALSTGCTGTNSITCNVATLTPGQIVEFDITIVPTALGTLTNTGATVTAGSNSGPVSTNVINNGVALVVEVDSANSADFVTTSPSGGTCTTTQIICTSFFLLNTPVTVTANGPGFIGWSVNGAQTPTCPATSNTCTVTLNSPQQVIAGYNAIGIASAQLTTGVVGFPYGSDPSKGIIGGVPPYTITLTGTLPNGLTFTAPSISGIPTTPGVTQLTVNITDSIGEKGSTPVTLTIISAPSGQEALANGNYGILFHGVNDSDGSLSAVVGSLHFNGKGLIDSGTLDTNGNSTGQVPKTLSSVTGTYTIGSDHRGLIKLQSAGATLVVLAMSVGDVYQGVAHTAHFVEFDDNTGTGSRGAGIAKLQDPNAFTPASMAGTYIIGNTGQDTSHNRLTEVGLGSLNATATITNVSVDSNDNGVLGTLALVSGTYGTDGSNGAISPVGRTQFHQMLTKTIGGVNTPVTANVAVYIVDANTLFKLRIDSGATNPIFAGTDERQMNPGSFSAASLSGPDVVAVQGPLNAGSQSDVLIGVGTFTPTAGANPTTGTLSFTKDENDGGNVIFEAIENDTYTAAATGRVVVTPASGNQVLLYLSRPDHGYVMGTDSSPVFGTIDLQTGGPFSDAALPANYFFGDREPASTTRGQSTSGVTTLSGNTLSTTFDSSHEGGRLDYATMGTFGLFVAPSGRMVFTNSHNNLSAIGDETGYVITPSHVVFTEIDPSQNRPVLHEAESFTMPPGVPFTTTTGVIFNVPVPIGSTQQSGSITISNVGDGLMSITGVTNAADFFASGSCVAPLPVVVISQGSCTFVITFAPTAGTPTNTLLNETVTLQTDAGTVTINASGTAAAAAGPPVLSITKSHVGNFTQGQQGAIYTVTVSNAANAGPTTGSVVVVTDTIPTGLTLTALSGSGWLCTVSTASCQTTVVLAGGASYPPITVTVNVAANATSPQVNVVNMVGGGSVAANASDSTVITPSTSPTLVSIAVTPANPSIAKGRTQQFTATGTFSDNSTQNITNSVTWASATTSVATISNTVGSQGLATSVGTGTSTISATMSGINGSTVLTVGPAVLAALNVTPKNQSIVVGSTLQFTATGTLTDGTIQDFTKTVTWSSSKLTVATISNTAPTQGLATAVSTVNSPTVITAVQGGIQDLTQLGVIAAPTFVLTVTEAGSGAGTVTSSPAGINCPTQCTASYASGTPVTLTATPATGSTFAGWSGACTNATGTCPVTMNQAQAVTATFNGTVTTFPLTVATGGTGTGTVTGNGINCTSGSITGCTVNLASGTAITLTAAPATGSTFAGWSATPTSCNVAGTTCTFSMPASAETATATFVLPSGPLLVPDFNVGGAGADDKQRIDGKSSPLKVGLTNTSKTQTVHVTGASADNPAYAVTTDCTTLGPGQACSVFATFKATQLCENQAGNITVADDDPGGNLIVSVNGYGADSGLQVDNLTNPALTAQALAQSLVGPGVTISNVKYTGALRAAGNFTGNSNIIGFGSGIVLSTGSVRNVVGPNCSSQIGVDNGQPGDANLNGLLGSGQTTNDAAVLEFDFVPASPSVSFQYVFSSDEYNEFVGQFNDVFAFFLNGNNIALLPTTPPVPVSINNVNTTTNPTFFVNNDMLFPNVAPVDTEMDGLTVVLTAQAQVTPNQTNHIKLAIADAIDFALDSNVFIKAGSLASAAVTLTPPTLGFGNRPVNTQSNPQQVTLANAGTATVNISSIVASAGFGETDNCPKQLAPAGQAGSSCTLNITFTPTSNVVFNGTVTVTDDSPAAGSQQVVTLSGTGTGTAPTLQSITVAPATASILAGTTQAFTATGHFSDGSSGSVTVTWSSGSPAIATINPATGVATGVTAGGPVTITATSTQITTIKGTAQLTIAAPILVSIAVTPADLTIVVGQQQQYTATGTFSDNSKQDITSSVAWDSSNKEAASITPSGGLATGLTGGLMTNITATKVQGNANIVGTTTLKVTSVPFVLTITPPPGGNPGAPPTVSPGGTLAIGLTLTATKGFNGTVTFSCVSNAPQFLTCAPAPSSVTLSGNTPKQVAIVMNTFCQGETPMYGPGPAGGLGGGLALLLAAAMLGSITWAYRTRSRWALSFAALMLIALGSAACGSPSSGPAGRTPAGTYTLNITATAGGASQTVQQQIQVTN